MPACSIKTLDDIATWVQDAAQQGAPEHKERLAHMMADMGGCELAPSPGKEIVPENFAKPSGLFSIWARIGKISFT